MTTVAEYLAQDFVALFATPSATAATVVNLNKFVVTLPTISRDFQAFHDAWMSKNIQDEILSGADIVKIVFQVAGTFYPPLLIAAQIIGIEEVLVPQLIVAIHYAYSLPGAGGFVTKSWVNDPAHRLNTDGSFVDNPLTFFQHWLSQFKL